MMDVDFGSIAQKTILTFLVAKYLRSYLETALYLPHWDKLLKNSWIAALLFLLSSELLSLPLVMDAYFGILVLTITAFVYYIKEQRPVRLLLTALYPGCAAFFFNGFFSTLLPRVHEANEGLFSSSVGISVAWLIGFGIYAQRQNKRERLQRQKDEAERKLIEDRKNELEHLVGERTAELTSQKEALEAALTELKSTQEQLVHHEKMASLGELTAGIAHEIQNPLNFVNNFAELSMELAQELQEEVEKSEPDQALVLDLARDLVQNQEKINHHGKRAANIVTGMLQHARTSTGAKEPIDLNALADEYLRLSYHGLRAKDSSFNAKMVTDFDPSVGKVAVIPQDMGRVLLNLINNAFYAVNQRNINNNNNNVGEVLNLADVNLADVNVNADVKYEPTVTVSTRRTTANTVEIRIRDNGTGIPEAVKAKIFQPFFTTKPTGQGTGLGLSLAYDIVTKGHGGTMEVESREGQGTEFVICLPNRND